MHHSNKRRGLLRAIVFAAVMIRFNLWRALVAAGRGKEYLCSANVACALTCSERH